MPLNYVDTSALIKCYLPEPGSAWMSGLVASEPIMISLLAVVEFSSALARRTREGALTLRQRDDVWRTFLRDTAEFAVLGLTGPVAREAAGLLFTGPPAIRLRALDALHLATARWSFARARRRGIATGSFVTADRMLLEAARWAGLAVINPEEHR